MIKRIAVCCTAALLLATATAAGAVAPKKKGVKAKAPTKVSTETLACRDGTEDRHARIGVVLAGGKVDSFAYYSKWKPRTCSIYVRRSGDKHSKWSDQGNITRVDLPRGGHFVIEKHQGAYRFVFHNIDREWYCGMDGKINGSLTVRKGAEHCQVAGIMEEGTPLGQAWAYLETQPVTTADALPVTTAGAALTTESPAESTQPNRRESYSFRTYND